MRRPEFEDRFFTSTLLFGALVVGGLVAVILGWRTAAATLIVPFQIPAFVSGGLGGLALIGMGIGSLHIQVTRQIAVDETAQLDAVLESAEALLAAMRDAP